MKMLGKAVGVGAIGWPRKGAERDEALALAAEIAALAPLAVRSIKQTMRGGLADDVRAALGRELREQQRLW